MKTHIFQNEKCIHRAHWDGCVPNEHAARKLTSTAYGHRVTIELNTLVHFDSEMSALRIGKHCSTIFRIRTKNQIVSDGNAHCRIITRCVWNKKSFVWRDLQNQISQGMNNNSTYMPAVKLLIKFCGLGPITCISPRLVMFMLVCVIICMYCIPTNRPSKNFVEPPSLIEHTRNARNFQCKAHILAFYLCFACIFGDVFELEKYFETLSQHLALLAFWIRYENVWKNNSKLLDKREPEMYRFGGIAVREPEFMESLVSSSSTLISRFVSEMISVYVPLLWIFLFFIHCLLLFPSFPTATVGFRFLFDPRLAAMCSMRFSFVPLIRNRISVVFIIMNVHRVHKLTHINKLGLISCHHQTGMRNWIARSHVLFFGSLIIVPFLGGGI